MKDVKTHLLNVTKEITSRSDDYSQWYNDIVKQANLAEHSAVRGCMVIKPYGFALWENMRDVLDRMFKETGHQNAYFPLFVPKSLFEAEEKNAEGFAKECAVVTHYRLMTNPENKSKLMVDPNAKLEEELIIRPTSEAIIWNTYRNWITSYRDLPILINQWANVVRWEMRTRLFLRTAEFLWQAGHTAHSTKAEAIEETLRMQEVYARFAEDYMAMPVWKGKKSDSERFAGAVDTYTIEALMQDGKALQAGTSHFLGQNFAEAFDVKFQNNNNKVVKFDTDKKKTFSFKLNEYDLHGVPVSIGVGKRDLEKGLVQVSRRDTLEKAMIPLEGLAVHVQQLLNDIQDNLFQRAFQFRKERTTVVDDFDTFKSTLEEKGGFLLAHWDGTEETEAKIKELSKATIRCIPFEENPEPGQCILSGQASTQRVVFAKAY